MAAFSSYLLVFDYPNRPPGLLDFTLDYPNGLNLIGQTFSIENLTPGNLGIYQRPGIAISLQPSPESPNTVYLQDNWSDYIGYFHLSGITVTLSKGNLASQEYVEFLDASTSQDVLAFRDGSVTVAQIYAALRPMGFNPTYAQISSALGALTPAPAPTSVNVTSPVGANILVSDNMLDPNGENALTFGPGSSLRAYGERGVEKVYVQDGTTVDTTVLSGGIDEIYVPGRWEDYALDASIAGCLILTRNVSINGTLYPEKIVVGASDWNDDLLVFADGAIRTNTAQDKVWANRNSRPTIASLGASWNPNKTTPGLTSQIDLDIYSNGKDYNQLLTKDATNQGSSIAPKPQALVSPRDISAIKVAIAGTGLDVAKDKLVLSSAAADGSGATATTLALDSNATNNNDASSGTTIGGIAHLRYSYNASTQVLTITPATGYRIAPADVDNIVSALVFKNTEAVPQPGVRSFSITLNNAYGDGPTSSASLRVPDITPPAVPVLNLGAGLGNGVSAAKALAASGVVNVQAEAGSTVTLTFTDDGSPPHQLSKTVMGTGSAVAVTLEASDIGTGNTQLQNGSIGVVAVATDVSGNSSPANSTRFYLDATAPTLAISSNQLALKANGTATIRFNFSEDPGASFTLADIVYSGGVLDSLTGAGTTRTATFTPTANRNAGKASLRVDAGSYSDTAGNAGGAGILATLDYDTRAPKLDSVCVQGSSVLLSFDAEVDSAFASSTASTINNRFGWKTAPAGGSYSAVNNAFTSATVSGNTIRLGLAGALAQGQTAQISYTPGSDADQATGVVQDGAGNDLARVFDSTVFSNPVITGFAVRDAGNGNGPLRGKAGEAVNVAVSLSESVTLTANASYTVHVQLGSDSSQGFDAVLVTDAVPASAASYTFSGSLPGTADMDSSELQLVWLAYSANASLLNASGQALTKTAYALSSYAYSVDSVIPDAPVLADGPGVTGTVSRSEATAASGVLTVKAGYGTPVLLTFTDSATHSVIKTLMGNGAALAASLESSDFGNGSKQLRDGSISVQAQAVDAAGNSSTAASNSFVLDATAPTLSIRSNKALVNMGSVANITFGFSETPMGFDASKVLVQGGTLGGWSGTGLLRTAVFTPTPNLDSSTASIAVAAGSFGDAAGNLAAASVTSFTVDTYGPTMPIFKLGSGVSGGATAAEATASSGVVQVYAEPGSTVTLTIGDSSTPVDTLTRTFAGSDSAIPIVLNASEIGWRRNQLYDGYITVTGVVTDAAGNTSRSNFIQFILDTIPPQPAVFTFASGVSDGASAAEATSSKGVFGVQAGNGESYVTVAITFSDSATPPHTVTRSYVPRSSLDDWPIVLNASDLGMGTGQLRDGTITVRASVLDLAGNETVNSTSFVLDATAPALQLASSLTGSPLANAANALAGAMLLTSSEWSVASVVFSRTDAQGLVHSVSKTGLTLTGAGSAIPVALTASDLLTLGDGEIQVSASAYDKAGNAALNGPATRTSFVLDTTPPPAPVLALTAGSLVGRSTALDGAFSVSAEAQSVVSIQLQSLDDNQQPLAGKLVTVSALSSGTAQAIRLNAAQLATLGDGVVRIRASTVDAAGNASASSADIRLTLDATAPAAPQALLLSDTGISNSDGISSMGSIAVSGFAADMAGWEYSLDSGAWVAGSGTLLAAQEGFHSYALRQTDVAGNAGPSTRLVVMLDTRAPENAPHINLPVDPVSGNFLSKSRTITVSGMETGAQLQYRPLEGSWTQLPPNVNSFTVGNGVYGYELRQVDAAGNLGSSSINYINLDLQAPVLDLNTASASKTAYVQSGVSVASLDNPLGRLSVQDNGSLTRVQLDISGLRDGANEQLRVGSVNTITLDGSAANSGSVTVGAVQWDWRLSQQNRQPQLVFVAHPDALDGSTAFSPAQAQALLQALGFENKSANPTGSSRVFAISLTDLAGNVSTPVSSTVDSLVPTAPGLKLAIDSGASSSDGITNTGEVLVSGLVDGASWQYQVDEAGSWQNGSGSSFNASTQSHSYRVRQTSPTGFTSPTSSSLTVNLNKFDPAIGYARVGDATQLTVSSDTTHIAPTHGLQLDGSATGKATLPAFVFGPDMSLEFWINPAGNNADAVVMQFESSDYPTGGPVKFSVLYKAENAQLQIEVRYPASVDNNGVAIPFNGVQTLTLTQRAPLLANQWTHVAMSNPYDGFHNQEIFFTNSSPTILINGINQGNQTYGDGGLGIVYEMEHYPGAAFRTNTLGQDNAGNNRFSGQLRDLRIYNHQRSVADITADMNGSFNPGDSRLVLAFGFNDTPIGFANRSDNAIAGLSAGASLQTSLDATLFNVQSGALLSLASNVNLAQVHLDVAGLRDGASDVLNVSTSATQQLRITLDGSAATQGSFVQSDCSWNWSLTTSDGQAHIVFGAGSSGPSAAQAEALVKNLSYQNLSTLASAAERVFSVYLTDLSGNVSPTLRTIIDNAAPPAPGWSVVDSGQSSTDRITNQSSVTLQGLESGATWQLQTDAGAWQAGSGSGGGSGGGSGSGFTALAGTHGYKLRQTDAAGNVSPDSSFTLTVDRIAPAAPSLQLQSDSGVLGNDGISNLPAIQVRGLEANASWQYQVDNSGSWTAGSGSSFNAQTGQHSYLVRQTDVAGNASAASQAISVNYIAPYSPAVPVLSLNTDSGSSGDGITNQPGMAISGVAAGNRVQYQVDENGVWVTLPGNASSLNAQEGSHRYSVRQLDLAGNASPASTPLLVLLDTSISAPTLALQSDTGASNSDGITQQGTVVVSGIETGATVTYQRDNNGINIQITNGSFNALADGNSHSYRVRQADAAGNISSASLPPLTIRVDNTAPSLQTASVNGRLLTLGYNEALASVAGLLPASTDFVLSDGNSVSSVQVSGSRLVLTLATPYVQGAAAFTLGYNPAPQQNRVQDLAGNAAPSISQQAVTNATPTAVLLTVKDYADSYLNSSETSITLSAYGNFASAATLAVYRADAQGAATGSALQSLTLGSASTQQDLTLSRASVGSDGSYALVAKYTPSTGSAATSNSLSLTVDTSITDASTYTLGLATGSDSGSLGDGITNIANPGISVGGLLNKVFKAGDLLQIIDSSNANAVVGSYTVLASDLSSGRWNTSSKIIPLTTSLGLGTAHVLQVRAQDAAGNSSLSTASMSLTLDTTPPASPVLSLASDTGSASNDGITRQAAITVQGLEALATWQYQVDGGSWSSGGGSGGGGGSSFNAQEGRHSYVVRQLDVAGNAASSAALVVTLNSSASLTMAVAEDNKISVAEGRSGFVVKGSSSAEDGQSVSLNVSAADAAGVVRSSSYSASVSQGQWQVSLPASATQTWGSGSISLQAQVLDLAGNSASASASVDYNAAVPVLDLDTASASSHALQTPRFALQMPGGDARATAVFASYPNLGAGNASTTVEVWVNLSASDTRTGTALQTLYFASVGSSNKQNYLELAQNISTGQLVLQMVRDGNRVVNAVSSTSVPTGQWVHLAATLDASNQPHLYLNGAELGWTAGSTTGNGSFAGGTLYPVLGAEPDITGLGNLHLLGQLRDVRQYAAVRSQAQVQHDMGTAPDTGDSSLKLAFTLDGHVLTPGSIGYLSLTGNASATMPTLTLDQPAARLSVSSAANIQLVSLDATGLLDGTNEVLKIAAATASSIRLNAASSGTLTLGSVVWNWSLGIPDKGSAHLEFTTGAAGGTGATASQVQALLRAISYQDLAPATTLYSYTQPTPGKRVFALQLRDVAGNLSAPANSSFDSQPPLPMGVSLSQDSGARATDNITQVGSVLVQNPEPGSPTPYAWQYAVDAGAFQTGSGSSIALQEGRHRYTVRRFDAQNQLSPNTSITVTLDTQAPVLNGTATLQTLGSNGAPKSGTLVVGDVLNLQLSLNEAAANLWNLPGQMGNVLSMDGTPKALTLRTEGNNIKLRYTLQAGDSGNFVFNATALNTLLTNSNITDLAGNALQRPASLSLPSAQVAVDSSLPVVTGIGWLGSSATGALKTGDVLNLAVSFNEAIAINTSQGSPSVRLQLGNEVRSASYVGTLGNKRLAFRYTVQASDAAPDGVLLPANALLLNGSVVRDVAGNPLDGSVSLQANAASLYRIDNTAPVLSSASVVGNLLTLTYTETLQGGYGQSATASDFVVRFAGDPVAVNAASTQGNSVVLVLGKAALGSYTSITVGYSASSSASDNSNIADAAGNRAASLVSQTVVNNTPNLPMLYVKPNASAVLADTCFNDSETSITLQVWLGSGDALAADSLVQLYLRGADGEDSAIGTAFSVTNAPSSVDLVLDRSSLSATAQAGSYSVVARYVDGDSSQTSAPLVLGIVAKANLSGIRLALSANTDSGKSTSDGITSNTQPVVRIGNLNGLPFGVNDVLKIIDSNHANAVLGQYVVQAGDVYQGQWSGGELGIPLTSALGAGLHTLQLQSESSVGNTSSSPALAVTIDNIAPVINSITVAGDNQLGVAEARADVVVSGTTSGVEDGQVLRLGVPGSSSGGASVYSAVVTGNSWQVTLPQTLVRQWQSGTLLFTATVQDVAGNAATAFNTSVGYSSSLPVLDLNSAAVSANQWSAATSQLYVAPGQTATTPNFNLGGSLTLEFWIYLSVAGNSGVLATLSTATQYIDLDMDSQGNLALSSPNNLSISLGQISRGQWTHITWVEPDVPLNAPFILTTFYINGVQTAQTYVVAAQGLSNGSSASLKLGNVNSSNHSLYRDVRVYDTQRSASEIQSDMQGNIVLTDSNLKAAYALDRTHWLSSSLSGQAALTLGSGAGAMQTNPVPLGNAPTVNSNIKLQQIKLSLGGLRDGAAEHLSVELPGAYDFGFDAAASSSGSFSRDSLTWNWTRTGSTLTLSAPSGGVTASQAQSLLRAFSYTTTANPPTAGERAVDIELIDLAGNHSALVTSSIAVRTTYAAKLVPVAAAIGLNQATQSVMALTAEAGSSVTLTFSSSRGSVSKTLAGSASSVAVALSAANLTTLGDGVVSVSAVQGNQSSSASFSLDTSFPAAAVLNTSAAVGNTVNQSLMLDGAVSVLAEAGSTVSVTFSSSAGGSVTRQVTGQGSTAVKVPVPASGLGNSGNLLHDGGVSVSASVTDVAGNTTPASAGGSVSFVLDATPPASPVFSYAGMPLAASTALLPNDLLGAAGISIVAEAGSTVDVLFSQTQNGTLHSMHKTVLGKGSATPLALTPEDLLTLGGGGLISLDTTSTDAAGNSSTAQARFTLNTQVPLVMLALSSGQDNTMTAQENALELQVGYQNLWAGDQIQLTLNNQPVAAPHTITPEEALAGYTRLGLERNDFARIGNQQVKAQVSTVLGGSGLSDALQITLAGGLLHWGSGTDGWLNASKSSASLRFLGDAQTLQEGAQLQVLLAGTALGTAQTISASDVANGFASIVLPGNVLGADGSKDLSVGYLLQGIPQTSNSLHLTLDRVTPVFTNVPQQQLVTHGVTADLVDLQISNAEANEPLQLTLLASNGTLGGLTDLNPTLPGIQLQGTAAQLSALLVNATFTATSAGSASIALGLQDAAHNLSSQTYAFAVL